MFNKTSGKFIFGFLGIIVLGLVVWYAGAYLTPEARQEREVLDYFADLEEQHENDTYGGETPEETLELFITALENEDIELASKYFLPEDREKWEANLTKVKKADNLDEMISDVSRAEKSKQENQQSLFVVTDKTNTVSVLINFAQNPDTGVWKIVDM